MREANKLVVAAIAVLAVIAASMRVVAAAKPVGWSSPYQPTRLEWLAHLANENNHVHCEMTLTSAGCIEVRYIAQLPAKVLVYVSAMRLVDARDTDAAVTARRASLDSQVDQAFKDARDLLDATSRNFFGVIPPAVQLHRSDSILTGGRLAR